MQVIILIILSFAFTMYMDYTYLGKVFGNCTKLLLLLLVCALVIVGILYLGYNIIIFIKGN